MLKTLKWNNGNTEKSEKKNNKKNPVLQDTLQSKEAATQKF